MQDLKVFLFSTKTIRQERAEPLIGCLGRGRLSFLHESIYGCSLSLQGSHGLLLRHLRLGAASGPDKHSCSNQQTPSNDAIDPLHSAQFSEPDSKPLQQQAPRRAFEKLFTLPTMKIRKKDFKILISRNALSSHLKKLLDIWQILLHWRLAGKMSNS